VPAAAVIPALVAYSIVVAVKTFVAHEVWFNVVLVHLDRVAEGLRESSNPQGEVILYA